VVLGPADKVLVASDNHCLLPSTRTPMLRRRALAFCKGTAPALFPRKAPEVCVGSHPACRLTLARPRSVRP
jgi:hypothetical protein